MLLLEQLLYIWAVGGEHTLKILTFYGKYGNIRTFFMVRCVVDGEHGLAHVLLHMWVTQV